MLWFILTIVKQNNRFMYVREREVGREKERETERERETDRERMKSY